MRIPEMILTNPEALQALRDNDLLAQFLEPKSPSEVARETGLAANLVHHHANRFLELGLLLEVKRENRRVFYQLSARRFKYDRNMLGEEPDNSELQELITAFSNAYVRSSHLEECQPDYSIHSFFERSELEHPNQANLIQYPENAVHNKNLEPHPAHYGFRTFSLSGAKYQELVKKITMLIAECEDEPNSSDGLCTLALLGFHGAPREGGSASAGLNSYVPI